VHCGVELQFGLSLAKGRAGFIQNAKEGKFSWPSPSQSPTRPRRVGWLREGVCRQTVGSRLPRECSTSLPKAVFSNHSAARRDGAAGKEQCKQQQKPSPNPTHCCRQQPASCALLLPREQPAAGWLGPCSQLSWASVVFCLKGDPNYTEATGWTDIFCLFDCLLGIG